MPHSPYNKRATKGYLVAYFDEGGRTVTFYLNGVPLYTFRLDALGSLAPQLGRLLSQGCGADGSRHQRIHIEHYIPHALLETCLCSRAAQEEVCKVVMACFHDVNRSVAMNNTNGSHFIVPLPSTHAFSAEGDAIVLILVIALAGGGDEETFARLERVFARSMYALALLCVAYGHMPTTPGFHTWWIETVRYLIVSKEPGDKNLIGLILKALVDTMKEDPIRIHLRLARGGGLSIREPWCKKPFDWRAFLNLLKMVPGMQLPENPNGPSPDPLFEFKEPGGSEKQVPCPVPLAYVEVLFWDRTKLLAEKIPVSRNIVHEALDSQSDTVLNLAMMLLQAIHLPDAKHAEMHFRPSFNSPQGAIRKCLDGRGLLLGERIAILVSALCILLSMGLRPGALYRLICAIMDHATTAKFWDLLDAPQFAMLAIVALLKETREDACLFGDLPDDMSRFMATHLVSFIRMATEAALRPDDRPEDGQLKRVISCILPRLHGHRYGIQLLRLEAHESHSLVEWRRDLLAHSPNFLAFIIEVCDTL